MRDHPEAANASAPLGQSRVGARALVGLGLLALAVRVASLALAAARSPYWGGFVADDGAYHAWAQRVSRGEGTDGVFFLSPLLSYVLGCVYWIAGERPVLWLGIQAVLGAFTAVAVAIVGARVFGRRAGLVAGGIVSLYGPLLLATESVLSETLHLALVWGAMLAWPAGTTKRSTLRAAAVGVLAAWAILARNYFVLALPLLALALWPRGRAAVLAFVGGVALGLAPATVHNLLAGEAVLVTSSGGVNLWLGNHPGANGRMRPPPGVSVAQIQDPARMARTFREAAEAEARRELAAHEVSSHFRAKAVDWMLGQPGAFVALVGARLRMTLEAVEHPAERNYYQAARFSPLLRWTPARWPVVLALAVAGLFGLRGRFGAFAPVAAAGAAALAALLLFWVSDRFRLPLVPALAVLAGGGVERLIAARGRARLLPLVAVAAAFALSLKLSWGREKETWMSHFNLGIQYDRIDAAEQAEAEARMAIQLAPGYANAHGLLAKALQKQGRQREAQRAYQEYLRLKGGEGSGARRGPANGR